MRTPLAAVSLAAVILTACATLGPWRAADAAQAQPGEPAEAGVTVAGVSVRLRAGGWRSWPEQLEDRVTPVEVTIRNDGTTPLEIRPERFSLEREGEPALRALHPRDLPVVLGPDLNPTDPSLLAYAPLPGQPGQPALPGQTGLARGVGVYDWAGLYASEPAQTVRRQGPDPRPSPLGVIPAGRTATCMIFFAVPGDRLRAYAVAVELAGAGGEPLGLVRLPFHR